MISKKDLENLINSIKSLTGKTQEEISLEAGYKAKSLTELLSGNANPEPAYKRLTMAFKDKLKNSIHLSKEKDDKSKKKGTEMNETSLSNEAILKLINTHNTLVEANKVLADAHYIEARNSERLLDKIDRMEHKPTASVGEGSRVNLTTRTAAIQAVLEEEVARLTGKTPQQISELVNKKETDLIRAYAKLSNPSIKSNVSKVP